MKKLIFACAVTIYNPTKECIDNIRKYKDSFDMVFIYDNSDNNSSSKNEESLQTADSKNIIYINGHGNQGLPHAFNVVLTLPELAKADFLCTLDQDSIFEPKDIWNIQNYIYRNHDKLVDLAGQIGPYIDYTHTRKSKTKVVENKVKKCSWIITSGAFLNLHILRKGDFHYDENYFIDKFEIDLCKQLTNKGYEILMYCGATLHQNLGETNAHHYPSHNSIRHYYLFRNRLYFNRKYYSIPKRWILNLLQTCRHLLLIILYENDKYNKLKALSQAIIDYKKNRFGKKQYIAGDL